MNYLMKNYARLDLQFSRGKGVWLFDENGEKYLDFISGVATNCLGHRHPKILGTIENAARQPLHISNFFKIKSQEELAKKLCNLAQKAGNGKFEFRVLFQNSGAESNEAALKLSRKFSGRKKFISFSGGFHGRTFGALSLTAKNKIQKYFKPLLANCKILKFNDFAELEKIDAATAAVIFEFVQGEGGVNLVTKKWVQKLFAKCKKEKVLTIADEVQTGAARCGTFFAFEKFGVTPDILTLAKGIGGGVPIGAVLAKKEIAKKFPQKIFEVRGIGFLIGVEFQKKGAAGKVWKSLIEKKILCATAGKNVLRILPPLIATEKNCDFFCEKLEKILIEI
jgi:acetylornithine aminotransferase/acetylornithine/N-succinyldiaminopimelate aminotransferase